MAIIDISLDNFEVEVIGSMKPVVVFFWADWSVECQGQMPVVDQIAEEMGDKVKICKCNVDECPLVAMKYGIMNLPSMVFMKEGMFQEKMSGLQDKTTIINYLDTLVD